MTAITRNRFRYAAYPLPELKGSIAMYTWQMGSGPARIEVKPLRPCDFQSRLSLSIDGNAGPIAGQGEGTVRYDLSAAQVATLRTDETAFLSLGTAHTRIPGAPDDSWGWQYRVVQNGVAPPSQYLADGSPPLARDAAGFLNSELEPYAANTHTTDETIAFS